MIDLQRKQQIILLHLDGKSNREIAREMHISKDTVNKYVNEYARNREQLISEDPDVSKDTIIRSFVEKPKYDSSGRTPRKMNEEVEDLILECLEENRNKRATGRQKQQMKIIDIHAYIKKNGCDVSYSSVKKAVRRLEDKHKEAFIRQEYEPGDICEFDWGTVKLNIGGTGYRNYQMAVFTSAYSNYRYAKLYMSQDTAAFQASHADCFAFCNGVFRTMVYDNMRTAVKKFVGPSEKEPTEALLQLSAYYGFHYRFCNIASGNEKGHVERSVEYIRRKTFCEPGADEYATLADANRALMEKCAELNNEEIYDESTPLQGFRKEQGHLLPGVPKFECCIRKTAHVDKYATVVYKQNHYSVPDTLVDEYVSMRVYTDKICIYQEGIKVAEHDISYRNHSWTIDIYHYLRTLRQKPGALAGSTAILQADAQTKDIYETYYNNDPKTFLEVLAVIREKGPDKVRQALEELDRLATGDKSADKVSVICDRQNEDGSAIAGVDRISRSTQDSLSNYDLLMKAQNEPERMAV